MSPCPLLWEVPEIMKIHRSFSASLHSSSSNKGWPFPSPAPAPMEEARQSVYVYTCAWFHPPPPLLPPDFNFPSSLNITLIWSQHTQLCSQAPCLPRQEQSSRQLHPVGPARPGACSTGNSSPDTEESQLAGGVEQRRRGWSSGRLHLKLACGPEG